MIPVLLVTSLDAREDRLAGIGAGANDFIIKPIDTGDLLLRVRNAVTTKRLHDEVTTQFRKLQELEAARDTLTHMIVHDLRSPLTGLQGYLDLLRMAVAAGSNDEILEFARDAHALADHLKEMISQVLDVSRLESGEMPLSPEDTDLVELLRRAVATLGPAPDGIGIIYETAVQPVVVACDGDVMTRVVANLVGNAFKFSPRRGEVRIGLERSNGVVRVTVTDNGPGVEPEYRKAIFEKFGQAPLGRAGKARSTGLGLTFCKLAVEAHGGKIGVDGSAGGGARFWIELPRKTESS
jgi:signal transduction histidine kinase